MAFKGLNGEDDYQLRINCDGYVDRLFDVSMPGDKDFTALLRAQLETITNSIGMELISIPAGTFQMGSTSNNANMRPVHSVTLTTDFWIGKYEVTQGEYRSVTGESPSYHSGDDRLPVEWVSWNEATAFANALSTAEGFASCYDSSGNVFGGDVYACEGYRLPTDAEWEYAARAGTTTEYSLGDDSGQLGDYAWDSSNAELRTHPVGQKLPNPWGLYDVHGNIWEWNHDWFDDFYYSISPESNPRGPPSGSDRVIRGGSWADRAYALESGYRMPYWPDDHYRSRGFRLARMTEPSSSGSPPETGVDPLRWTIFHL